MWRFVVSQLRRWGTALNPQHSLQARMALLVGLLGIVLTVGLLGLSMLGGRPGWQMALGGVATAVCTIIAWVSVGRVARPLRVMAETARELHENRHDHDIPTFPGDDEIATLSRALNNLVGDLQAQQIALREANDTLEQHVAARTHQLATLYAVLAISSEMEALPVLLQRALTRILQASRADAGAIHLMGQAGQPVTMTAHFRLPDAVAAAYARVPHDHALVQETMQQTTHLFIANVQATPYADLFGHLSASCCVLCLPIRKGEQNLGILSIFLREAESLAADEIALLSSLADQLGILIENARLRQQAEQLAVVDERNRLARELHDSVTQALYSATLFAEAGQKQAQMGNMDKALTYLDEVLQTSRQALKEMRLLVHKLRPLTLKKEGLVRALDQRLKAVEGRAGISQQLLVSGSVSIPADIEETLYYVAVEALNNALKHAQAAAVTVTITQSETAVSLQVADSGVGFEWETAVGGGGLGLTSMQERVAEHDGTLSVETAPGGGTTVTAVLPLTAEM